MTKELLRKNCIIGFLGLGLILAVVDANKPEPKEFSGVGEGYNGQMTINIKVKSKKDSFKILGVKVKHIDTPPIADPAIEKLKGQTIIKQNSEIDGVSGATYTSNGYKEGLKNAIGNIKF